MHVIPEAEAVPVIPEAVTDAPAAAAASTLHGKARIGAMLRPHWKALIVACVAVIGETGADIAEPWPVKIVVDNLLQNKKLPAWATSIVSLLGQDKIAILNFALAAVLLIAIVGAVSSY